MDKRDLLFMDMTQSWYAEARAVINEYSGQIEKDQAELRASAAARITEWEDAGGSWTMSKDPENWK
jgi:hypothetical protein